MITIIDDALWMKNKKRPDHIWIDSKTLITDRLLERGFFSHVSFSVPPLNGGIELFSGSSYDFAL